MDFLTKILIGVNSETFIAVLSGAFLLFIYFGFRYHYYSKCWKIGDVIWSSVAGLALVSGLIQLKSETFHSSFSEYQKQLSFQLFLLDNYVSLNKQNLPCIEGEELYSDSCIPQNYKHGIESKTKRFCKLDYEKLTNTISSPSHSPLSEQQGRTSWGTDTSNQSPIRI